MKAGKLLRGASADGILLTAVKFVTILLGLAITRLLSEHLSSYDYGTYAQILLMVSTVSSLTILGMMDGVNYFYSSCADPEKREKYLSTIFCLQSVVSAVSPHLSASGCPVQEPPAYPATVQDYNLLRSTVCPQ